MNLRDNMGYQWNLRSVMADRGMYQTTDMQRALATQGVQLSREQVYRIVTRPPARLNIELLIALCNVLECTPNDLIDLSTHRRDQTPRRDTGTDGRARAVDSQVQPVSARVRRPKNQ